MPTGQYFTDTVVGSRGTRWLVGSGNVVNIRYDEWHPYYRAICVPDLSALSVREAEEKMRRVEAEARKAKEARKAEEAQKLREFGLFALSDAPMNWPDAVAFCQQQGGRLPRINNSDSSGGNIVSIDGIGVRGPWPSGLPRDTYWTGTTSTHNSGYSWTVRPNFNQARPHSEAYRVVCIPSDNVPAPASVPQSASTPAALEAATPAPAATAAAPTATPSSTATPPPTYPPLTDDGKPKAAVHLVRLENDTVELALQILAPGKSLEAIRIDNMGGASSRWRSDGKEESAPLSVSRDGNSLSSGSQAMNLALGDAETLLSLFLKDNGAFAGRVTDFRVTLFFSGGERAMCALSASNFPAAAPGAAQAEKQTEEVSFFKAAEQGDADAQYSLGQMLLTGNGVSQDAGQAAYWLRKAAEQGVIIAQYKLGEMYMEGNGVPQDVEQATYWFRRAVPAQTAQAPPEPSTSTRKTAETRKAEEAHKGKFIAVSSTDMNWFDAVAFCQQRGGSLPLINGSTSLGPVLSDATIDGFGNRGGPWPLGLLAVKYWTGTELTEVTADPDDRSWFVTDHDEVVLGFVSQSAAYRVACVPNVTNTETARKAEAHRMAEAETRKAEEVHKGKFIAVSESRMNWPDAVAFCQQRGGSLPRINNSDSWKWDGRSEATIDGFGASGNLHGTKGDRWPSGLPGNWYWTGTEATDTGIGNHPYSWFVYDHGGTVYVGNSPQILLNKGSYLRVACVPNVTSMETARKAAIAGASTPPSYGTIKGNTWTNTDALCPHSITPVPEIYGMRMLSLARGSVLTILSAGGEFEIRNIIQFDDSEMAEHAVGANLFKGRTHTFNEPGLYQLSCKRNNRWNLFPVKVN